MQDRRRARVVFRGHLFKRGKLNKGYKARFFVLLDDGKMRYFQDPISSMAKGIVDLHHTSSIDVVTDEARTGVPNACLTFVHRERAFFIYSLDYHTTHDLHRAILAVLGMRAPPPMRE